MTRPRLDLSKLNAAEATPAATVAATPQSDGTPLLLLVADVEPDPGQPRKNADPEKFAQLVAGIKARGVKSPISVRPHPEKPGKWWINHGENRWRASVQIGNKEIPAFIDKDHDDFDQVMENSLRDDLKPMEYAIFFAKKVAEGMKQNAIAAKLHMDPSDVTHHLALIDAPSFIEDAYRSGKCQSPKTLYDLRKLGEKFAEQVAEWCESAEEITRKTVAELSDELKGKKKKGDSAASTPAGNGAEKIGHDQFSGSNGTGDGGDGGNGSGDGSSNNGGSGNGAGQGYGQGEGAKTAAKEGHGQDNGELTSWPRGKAVSDPDSMKKPLLLVEHDGRAAAVLLNRKPSTQGLLRIRYEDGGGDAEVDAGSCKINSLVEAEK